MMIKKQIGILAGSVVLASSANAAIVLGSDALAVFSTVGQGTFYQVIDAGTVTADSLASGQGFQIDVSGASAALGGTIESFAILALSPGVNTYNYSEFVYVDLGGGLVTAGNVPTPSDNATLSFNINNIQAFLNNADLGGNGEGSLGDFDGNANVAGYLTSGVSGLVSTLFTLGGAVNSQVVSILAPGAAADGVYLDGPSFNATAQGGAVIPVPAAAWLFGSALLGLGVVRRKK